MILLDALYINEGGGKILLDFIIEKLERSKIPVFYLLDKRIMGDLPPIKSSNVVEFLTGSLLKRHVFYIRNQNAFSKVLCFGNVPPTVRLKSEVFTYFHNVIILDVPGEYSLVKRVKLTLKKHVIKYFDYNTTSWLVQSNFMGNKLEASLNVSHERVLVYPFFKPFRKDPDKVYREKTSYIYVSHGRPHKNHIRLINVFCKFFDIHKKGLLILTINMDYPILNTLINTKIKEGYPIKNIGFVDRETLEKVYLSSEYLIFPSLKESLGLGLIEAIECGCKIMGADLPYTYEVCYPSIIFNPNSSESMLAAFDESVGDGVIETTSRIKNNINEIIDLLK